MERSRRAQLLAWTRCVPLVALVIVAALAAASPRSPTQLIPEHAWHAPSVEFPLGCGEAGVDLLALVGHATLRAIAVACVVALAGWTIGAPLGAAAALARGRFERAVVRACDLVQAFPTFLFALVVLSAVRTPSRLHIALVFALTAWAPFARLSMAQTRIYRGAAFVEAVYALGGGTFRVIALHLLPNVVGILAVQLGATAAAIVVSEAALAFVGFGPRDGVSLGALLDQGVAAMLRAPHVLLVASSAIFLTSAALMLAGRAFDRAGTS